MSYKIYHNPRCSKSRQTLGLMRDNGIEPTIIEYLKNIPSKDELSTILNQLNMSPMELMRKGESDYKEHVKGKDLSDDQLLSLMVDYPKLIERPIVIKNKKAVLGRPPENVLQLLDN